MKLKPAQKMLISLGVVVALYIVWLIVAPFMMPRPANLGIQGNGQLAACPDSPNCVSSYAEDELHFIKPIECNGQAETVFKKLVDILENQPRVTIIKQNESYVHAECTTPIMRYTDDLECLADPANDVIHVRSASRLGYSDLGKNRQRIEELRRQLNESFKAKDVVK